MNILLVRDKDQPHHWTYGRLYVDGAYECETLEDVVREVEDAPVGNWKVHGDTAIPRGRYRVVITHSNRFQKDMPELLNVPGWAGVRIHPGNTEADTEGCILLGLERGATGILKSRDAYNSFFADLREALTTGEQAWITIQDEA